MSPIKHMLRPSLEPSSRDGSNEGSQHMFLLRDKKKYLCIIIDTPLIWSAVNFPAFKLKEVEESIKQRKKIKQTKRPNMSKRSLSWIYAYRDDSDQPAHPYSLIRLFLDPTITLHIQSTVTEYRIVCICFCNVLLLI